ncbi:MAG: ABC transporter permease, partial [Calditrichaeota bacterium]
MFKNYLKIAFRNLRKQKTYTFINISGLALGMACFILIFLYVSHEYSYDRFHENVDRIYRVIAKHRWYDQIKYIPIMPAPLAPELVQNFPEVISATRFGSLYNAMVSYQNKHFYETGIIYADASIFQIFTFPLLKGNPETALIEPFSVVITEKIAIKYFGNLDPIGKILKIEGVGDFRVTGILKRIPTTSHLQFNMLVSFSTLYQTFPDRIKSWFSRSYLTYILLSNECDPKDLENKLQAFVQQKMTSNETVESFTLYLQPLTDIYLRSNLDFDMVITSDIKYIYIFSGIGIFILILACINFMNLSTAQSMARAKEIGVRKILGSLRLQLVKQFLLEAKVLSLMALLLALVTVEIILPWFNDIMAKNLHLDYRGNFLQIIIGSLGLSLLVGFVAGSYPAFFLSALRPVNILKAPLETDRTGSHRKVLVIFQFFIAIILIFSTVVVSWQLHYMRNKRLGINTKQVVVIPIQNSAIQPRVATFKQELLQSPNVFSVSASSNVPVRSVSKNLFRPEGAGEESSFWMHAYEVDADFIATLDIKLIAGRNFLSNRASASILGSEFIINKTAAKTFGWSSPIGKRIYRNNRVGTIVGLVQDFHIASLHHKIEPVVLYLGSENARYLLVKIGLKDVRSTIAFLKEKWKNFEPVRPFNYAFLDEYFDQAYWSEKRLAKMIKSFAFVAIFIACLGLFGLAAYTAERRTKEIGIRKALGASVANIVALLS